MSQKKKVLILLPRFFYPANDGGKIVFFDAIKNLGKNYDIDCISNVTSQDLHHYKEASGFLKNLWTINFDVSKQYFLLFFHSLITGTSYFEKKYFRNDFISLVDRAFSQNRYDIVWIESGYLGKYGEYIKKHYPLVKVILRSHNIESQVLENTAKFTQNFFYRYLINREYKKIKVSELADLNYIDTVYAISPDDVEYFNTNKNADNTTNISLLYPGINFEKYKQTPITQKYNLVFMGNLDYLPNYDGLKWFVSNVFEKVLGDFPDAKLYILGNRHVDFLDAKFSSNIVFDTGKFPDIYYYDKARIFICPLFSGGGVKIKVIQAMACGKPVITTSIGTQGLDVVNEQHIIIQDNAEKWIEKIKEYFANDEKLLKIGLNGYDFVVKNFDSRENYKAIFETL